MEIDIPRVVQSAKVAGPGRRRGYRDTGNHHPGQCDALSRTSVAKRTGLSPSTIGRICRKLELKPHLTDGFKLSTDPQFVDKVIDVVGL